MSGSMRVAVLGGGNAAFSAAADLKLKGCTVHLFEVPELAKQTIGPIQEQGGIDLIAENVPGVKPGFAALDLMTDDPAKALADVDLVLYLVPAFAEKRFTELCAPYFRSDQLITLFCGNFGGALELAKALKSRQLRPLPLIAETEQLLYGGFKQSPTSVKIGSVKAGLACAALPSGKMKDVLRRIEPLFSDFHPAANVLETGLRNLNPVLHAPITLFNAGRVAADRPKWRYYWEGMTTPIGQVVDAVDRERLAVAEAVDLRLPTAKEVILGWYGRQGAHGDTVGEVVGTNPAYEIAWAPQTLNHRFLTEDVPFGLVPTEALGRSVHVTTPVTSALITLSSELLGQDFRREGRDLARLGLEGLDVSSIKRLLAEG